jgi:FAD/FMN-containing dehydrogenase
VSEESVRRDALAEIRQVVGEKGWIDDPDEMRRHLVEWRGLWTGVTPAIVKPSSTDEVARVVRLCADARIPIVPQAGNTSLCGGSVPDESGRELVLSVARLNRIREFDPIGDTLTAEAGCVLAEVQRAADAAGRLFPLSLAAEGSCQIGGNLSTNAGGVHVLRYGNMRELVLGLEVVLPDGRVWDGLRHLRKDNTGYDLKQIFIGAEGTLGVITAAVLRLFPRPRQRWVAFVAVHDVATAVELLGTARERLGSAIVAFELMPRIALDLVVAHIPGTRDPLAAPSGHYVLIELTTTDPGEGELKRRGEDWLAAALARGLVRDAVVAESEAQIAELWRLRESVSEAQKLEGASVKHDVAVPISRLPEFMAAATRRVEAEWPGVRVVAFGHVGDGNVHFNLQAPRESDRAAFLGHWGRFNRVVHELVHEMRGSIAAEHGIGRLKREELILDKSEVEIDLMRTLKRTLDPNGIMNPGRVV